jgi:hypothetical protein
VNQLAVCDAIQPRRRTDALNPQPAILAFFNAAIAKRIAIRSIRRFLCGLIQLALCEEKAFGPFEVLLAARTALCAAFYASHGFLLFCLGRQHDAGARKEMKTRVTQRVCLRGYC